MLEIVVLNNFFGGKERLQKQNVKRAIEVFAKKELFLLQSE